MDVCSERELSVKGGERKTKSRPVLDRLSVFGAGRRESAGRLMPARTAVRGGYQATRRGRVTGARETGKMNRSADKGFVTMKGGVVIARPLAYFLSRVAMVPINTARAKPSEAEGMEKAGPVT